MVEIRGFLVTEVVPIVYVKSLTAVPPFELVSDASSAILLAEHVSLIVRYHSSVTVDLAVFEWVEVATIFICKTVFGFQVAPVNNVEVPEPA